MNQFLKWRIIPTEIHDAFTNMAVDEACCEAVAGAKVPPTVRFYRWQPSAVSIGTFQSMNDEVAVAVCRQAGVDIVRRRTGGGAVYHDIDGEITYSVIGPEVLFPKDIIESYRLICGWVINGLKRLGLQDVFFHPINDILAYGKKISGNAQTRRQGVLLQHGTVLYTVDVKKMFSFLTVGQDKLADKLISSVEDRVTSVHALLPQVTMKQLEKVLQEGFMEGVGGNFELGEWTELERERAKINASERYSTQAWNFAR